MSKKGHPRDFHLSTRTLAIRQTWTVSSLPEEVLRYIFEVAGNCFDNGSLNPFHAHPWVLVVRLVCRYWKRALDECPRFWASLLGLATNKRVWNFIMRKAGVTPVSISTSQRVPFSRQIKALSRASQVYITKDTRRHHGWEAAISSFPDLPMLRTLHLMRSDPRRRNAKPLAIRAINLENLSLDRPASVSSSRLRALSLTKLNIDMISCLDDILGSNKCIQEITIDDCSCRQQGLWEIVFDMISSQSDLESLSVKLNVSTQFLQPFTTNMPTLKNLHAEVLVPIASSSLEHLHANLDSRDLMETLTHNLGIKTLVLQCHKMTTSMSIPVSIILPRCTRIEVETALGRRAVDTLSALQTPRLEEMVLHVYVPIEVNLYPPPGVSECLSTYAGPSPCYFYEVARDDLRRMCRILDSLSSMMRQKTLGPVTVSIDVTRFDSKMDHFVVTFRGKDSMMEQRQCGGLCLFVYVSHPICLLKHMHVNTVSIAHMLRVFSWPRVEALNIVYSLPDSTHADDRNTPCPFWPDPLSAILSKDKEELEDNLSRMTGLRSIKITVTQKMFVEGVSALRALGINASKPLCLALATVHLVADRSMEDGYPGRAQLWYDLRDLFRSRRSKEPSTTLSRMSLILEGNFIPSYEDSWVLEDMREIVNVFYMHTP